VGTDAIIDFDANQELAFFAVPATYVLIGPKSGASALPTFRALASEDIPSVLNNGYFSGAVGAGIGSPATQLHVVKETATTNAILEVARFEARVTSTGVGAVGFGPAITFFGESATNGTYRQMGQLSFAWVTATDATRKAQSSWSVWDTVEREVIRIEASGTEPKIGFLGAAPVAQKAALTAQLTTIKHTAPGTPDYAIQNLSSGGYGFVTRDEGNTVLSVIRNLQVRVAELEAGLSSAAGFGLFR
jgi:hypothetical protein